MPLGLLTLHQHLRQAAGEGVHLHQDPGCATHAAGRALQGCRRQVKVIIKHHNHTLFIEEIIPSSKNGGMAELNIT